MGQKNQNKFFNKNIFCVKSLNIFLLIIILALGVLYIAGGNDLSIKGFAVSDLKEQRSKLTSENKKLEIEAVTLNSFKAVNEKISGLKMVAVGSIDYLNPADETVAKK